MYKIYIIKHPKLGIYFRLPTIYFRLPTMAANQAEAANPIYQFMMAPAMAGRRAILDGHVNDSQSPFGEIFRYMAKTQPSFIKFPPMKQDTETVSEMHLCIMTNNVHDQLFIPTKEEFLRYAAYPYWAINKLQEPGNNMTVRIMASRIKNIKNYAEANMANDKWSVMYDSRIIKTFPTRAEALEYLDSFGLSCTLVSPRGFGIE